jgi:uncharacterized protein YbcI
VSLGNILSKEEKKIFDRKEKITMSTSRTEKIERFKNKNKLKNDIEVKL